MYPFLLSYTELMLKIWNHNMNVKTQICKNPSLICKNPIDRFFLVLHMLNALLSLLFLIDKYIFYFIYVYVLSFFDSLAIPQINYY